MAQIIKLPDGTVTTAEELICEINELRQRVHRLTNLLQEMVRSEASHHSWCGIIEHELTSQPGAFKNAKGLLAEENSNVRPE